MDDIEWVGRILKDVKICKDKLMIHKIRNKVTNKRAIQFTGENYMENVSLSRILKKKTIVYDPSY
jgi:hypothetical protein